MELALSVIGQMASRSMRVKSAEFWGWICRGRGSGSFLVHLYLDRCAVAEVA